MWKTRKYLRKLQNQTLHSSSTDRSVINYIISKDLINPRELLKHPVKISDLNLILKFHIFRVHLSPRQMFADSLPKAWFFSFNLFIHIYFEALFDFLSFFPGGKLVVFIQKFHLINWSLPRSWSIKEEVEMFF